MPAWVGLQPGFDETFWLANQLCPCMLQPTIPQQLKAAGAPETLCSYLSAAVSSLSTSGLSAG